MIKYLTMTIEKQKNIALIANDGKKQQWSIRWRPADWGKNCRGKY